MKKIFVLGDSRTGTLSLSNYFNAIGLPTIHYFEKEAEQLPHTEENRFENFRRIKKFIEESGAVGFSDYPTRLYYRELVAEYPDAFYIHTVRKDLKTWKKSMLGFFSKFHISINIDNLSAVHTEFNKSIFDYFSGSPELKFLEICIDDGSELNSKKLKDFLGVESDLELGWDNKTSNLRNDILSGRCTLISCGRTDLVNQLEKFRSGYKGALSEFGWVYLINDSNRFLHYLYGSESWGEVELNKSINILNERRAELALAGIKYFKFVVPEKAVVYPEYLPKVLRGVEQSQERPANKVDLACGDFVNYLAEYLIDAKSYGPLYFRGDTHPNWLGAYLVYQYIIKKIKPFIGAHLPSSLSLGVLSASLCGYDGDVFTQISPDDKARLNDQWSDLQLSGVFEYCIKYELPSEKKRAVSVVAEGRLAEMRFSREIIITEIDDPSLPTAVIFRDSTGDYVVNLLAEHFRRAVFVWHRGEVVKEVLEIEKPDIVIHLMAERFVTSYAENMVALSNYFPD